MICYIKEIQRLLSTLTKKYCFSRISRPEKPVMNFKYFQALQGPVRTLRDVNDLETVLKLKVPKMYVDRF